MAVKKRGLGRGLDALLSSATANTLQEPTAEVDAKELQHLKLDCIQRGKKNPVGIWIRPVSKSWRNQLKLKG